MMDDVVGMCFPDPILHTGRAVIPLPPLRPGVVSAEAAGAFRHPLLPLRVNLSLISQVDLPTSGIRENTELSFENGLPCSCHGTHQRVGLQRKSHQGHQLCI